VFLKMLSPEEWQRPSTCDQWQVADVIGHLDSMGHGFAERLSRGLQGDISPSEGLPSTSAHNEDAFATDAQKQPFIYLLAIAKMDIKPKRCGIWAVKPRLLEGVDESWMNVLSRTRHGFIRI
jgi:hypothetical protein